MKKVKFNIQGMACSSCSSHVERAVKKLDGIKEVNVNLLSNNMLVEYDEKKLNNEKIIKAVVEAGYGASIDGQEGKKSNIKDDNESILSSMKKRLIISICFLIPLMYVAMNHMLNEWFGFMVPEFIKKLFHGSENSITFSLTQFLLLLPIIYVNRNYFIVGLKRLFKRTPNMDSLIAIGSLASTIYGIFAIYKMGYGLGHNQIELVEQYSKNLYFESAGMILTLITVGKYLETKSKGKTSEAIEKLINLAPKTATVIRENNEIEINIEEIIVEDIIVIKPGGKIPVDGVVIEGNSSIDQSSITGESIPVIKSVGDKVVSGSINKNGSFKMRATKVGQDTTLSQIIKLVEEASNSKAPIAKLADKVSSIFVPTVILIAIITTIFWIMQGQSFEFALNMGISVLVISCPCALGLATPVAIMVGTGNGAQNGILIKSAESLELLHQVDTVVLDKTGTITQGKPKVTNVVSKIDENDLLRIAASLEKNSEHPLSEAIIEKTEERKLEFKEVKDFESISGRGVKAKIDEIEYFCGNIAFIKENGIECEDAIKQIEYLLSEGNTVIYIANKNEILGMISVADTIKKTSYEAIKELKKNNIEVVMITGDNKVVAESIGKSLGINAVISEVLPKDKQMEVDKLQKQGKRVTFVGDGINDSPALVKSDVGIAIGSGTDIAIESADIVLIKNSLLDVVNAINLSKAVIRNIKINLFWAFFYNIIGIPVAAGVFYNSFGLALSPMLGALAMSLSSVCVVTNALRLRKFKSKVSNEIIVDQNIKNDKKERKNMKTIFIEGMQCNHCKMTVEKVLGNIDGIIKVEVNLENKNANIETEKEISNETIIKVIEEAGFIVKEIV